MHRRSAVTSLAKIHYEQVNVQKESLKKILGLQASQAHISLQKSVR